MKNTKAAIILAGGLGKRMKSDLPKVLHQIKGKPMILYTLDHLRDAGFDEIVVLVGHKKNEVMETIGSSVTYAFQNKPLGTGDAAFRGLGGLNSTTKHVLVVNGDDSAFYDLETFSNIYKKHIEENSIITFTTAILNNPLGIGRVVRDDNGNLIKIVEEKEATEDQKKIQEANIGLYVFDVQWLKENAPNIRKSISGEYYIVDLIETALNQGKKVLTFEVSEKQWHGINTKEQLVEAEIKMKNRTL